MGVNLGFHGIETTFGRFKGVKGAKEGTGHNGEDRLFKCHQNVDREPHKDAISLSAGAAS